MGLSRSLAVSVMHCGDARAGCECDALWGCQGRPQCFDLDMPSCITYTHAMTTHRLIACSNATVAVADGGQLRVRVADGGQLRVRVADGGQLRGRPLDPHEVMSHAPHPHATCFDCMPMPPALLDCVSHESWMAEGFPHESGVRSQESWMA